MARERESLRGSIQVGEQTNTVTETRFENPASSFRNFFTPTAVGRAVTVVSLESRVS